MSSEGNPKDKAMDTQTQQQTDKAQKPAGSVLEWEAQGPAWWVTTMLGLLFLSVFREGEACFAIVAESALFPRKLRSFKRDLNCTLEEAKQLAEQLGLELVVDALTEYLTPPGVAALFKGAELSPVQQLILRCADRCTIQFVGSGSEEAVAEMLRSGGHLEVDYRKTGVWARENGSVEIRPSRVVEGVSIEHGEYRICAERKPRHPTEEEKALYFPNAPTAPVAAGQES